MLVKSICAGPPAGGARTAEIGRPAGSRSQSEIAASGNAPGAMTRIQTWPQLSASQRAGVAALLWSEGDTPGYAAVVNEYRAGRRRYSDYRALVATDAGGVVGHLATVRARFRSDQRTQTVCGVCDVVVRPDTTRRGIATELLRRAHREARGEGLDWSFLWTRRSWGAHRVYERLGYRDLYSFPTAVLPPRSRPRVPGPGARLRRARPGDLDRLDRLLAVATRDRLGFVERFPRSFRHRIALGWRTVDAVQVLEMGRRPRGYTEIQLDPFSCVAREIVIDDPQNLSRMLDAIEAYGGTRWIGMACSSFVSDARSPLEQRGYRILPSHHAVLMGCPLTARGRDEAGELQRTFVDPRFFVQRGDLF